MLGTPFPQLAPDRLGSETLLVQVPGLPDPLERLLGDRDPARPPQVGYGVLPQVTVEGGAGYAQQIADLFDRVDGPPPTYHANILKIFSSASILAHTLQRDTMRLNQLCNGVLPDARDKRAGERPGTARTTLSRRDNGGTGLEIRLARLNTHRRQNRDVELQVDVKLTHTEGECVMLKLSRLLWAVLAACAFLALGGGCAEAKTGLASWYGPGFEGLPTASGEPYDPYGYTAAHKTMPLGTDLVVRYGGSSVQVTVNDRGPR